jgi:hypothetical protein
MAHQIPIKIGTFQLKIQVPLHNESVPNPTELVISSAPTRVFGDLWRGHKRRCIS